jgi:peptidyl-tRNA hydrolase, PTH2 family
MIGKGLGGLKQVIVVRKDIAMGRGKLAAQVAHASVIAAERTRHTRPDWLKLWFATGQPKVVLKVNNLDELLDLESQAQRASLAAASVQDSGLTQIPSGTVTCMGIGPGPVDLIDKLTGHLKLL